MTPEELAALQARAYTHMEPWSAADFAGLLARPSTWLTCAGHGFLLAQIVVDEAEILSLAVDPAFQRQGEARALLARLDAEARTRGVTSLHLEVAAQNAPARAFYDAQGFTGIGLRRGYYRRPDGSCGDAVLMKREVR